MGFNFDHKSFIDVVIKDINKKDSQLRVKAARYLKRKIAAKIKNRAVSAPGQPPGMKTGNLLKGLRVKGGDWVAYVGFAKPAYHASLLEFGGKSNPRSTKKGQERGYMAARPVLFPTFAEEEDAVAQILSEKRV